PIRMLLLEESPATSQSILEELHAAGMAIEPTVARSCREFLDAIAIQNFSLIVSAYRLRDWSALEALNAMQEAGKQAPFIVISDELGETEVEECLRHGVNDCVLKSQLARLPATVRRVLEEAQLRKANREGRRALAESESLNHELIENSVYGICRVGLDGAFISANPSLLQMLACPTLEALQTMNLFTEVFRFPEHCVKVVTSCRKDGLVHSADTEGGAKMAACLPSSCTCDTSPCREPRTRWRPSSKT
ncbi:MAG: response regulator, partial [Candidatus Acidiferrum sp.]